MRQGFEHHDRMVATWQRFFELLGIPARRAKANEPPENKGVPRLVLLDYETGEISIPVEVSAHRHDATWNENDECEKRLCLGYGLPADTDYPGEIGWFFMETLECERRDWYPIAATPAKTGGFGLCNTWGSWDINLVSSKRPLRRPAFADITPFWEVVMQEVLGELPQPPAETYTPRVPKQEVKNFLIGRNGLKCVGCDNVFSHPRFLEIDHVLPRSDGGADDISNLALLCGPCNRLKSNRYTMSGLRKENKSRGFMARDR